MSNSPLPPEPAPRPEPRDAANWAEHGTHLRVSSAPAGAVNWNVEGRDAVGPLQGFGQMWQKTYRVSLAGAEVTPAQVILEWKKNFPDFWPKGNRFYLPLTGITPGEVALLNLRTAGLPLSTGVLVLYADDESFTLMTPQGHMFAGWITFSAFRDDNQGVIAQAQVLMRANDPLFEMALAFGGQNEENRFWIRTLTNLAAYFHRDAAVTLESRCVDKRRQWRYANNLWQNSALRTLVYTPARWFGRGGSVR